MDTNVTENFRVEFIAYGARHLNDISSTGQVIDDDILNEYATQLFQRVCTDIRKSTF